MSIYTFINGDELEPLIIGKPVGSNPIPESIARELRARGSLYDCNELSPDEALKVDLYSDTVFSFILVKKNKYELVVYPTTSRNLRVFMFKNRGAGGTDNKNEHDRRAGMGGTSNGAQKTPYEAVNITDPKNGEIVKRAKYGIYVSGSAFVAKSVKLDWGGGTQSINVDDHEFWDKNYFPLSTGEYTLTATVSGDSSTVEFTVILKPVIKGYTAEQIQAVKNDRPGHPQQTPTKSGNIAIDAGLLTLDDPLVTQDVHIDDVKALVGSETGDYNLFYSGSGDKAFIEKRIDFILGTNLSEKTKTDLVSELLSKKTPGFLDVTAAYHEGMNTTLENYFVENEFETFVANLDSPVFYQDPGGYLLAEIVKIGLQVKLKAFLMFESNGAPLVMQKEARMFVFISVATSVVGGGVSGAALKVSGNASKVSKSYFNKFKHKFTSKNTKPPSGLHNQEWDDVITPSAGEAGAFQTSRKIDMKNLSPEDRVARKKLMKQGVINKGKQKEILSSGGNFKSKDYDSGDDFYSFGTAGRKFSNSSVYRLDEAGFKDVQSKFHKNGKWDSAGIKNYLALPCKNRANTLYKTELVEKQTLTTSKIGSASESVAYEKHGNLYPGSKIMTGGGKQVIVDTANLSKGKKLW